MARRQQEIQREAERQRKEAAERKFQERKASRLRRQQEEQERLNNDSSRGSTPTPVPPTNRSDSPPIPALRNSQNNSSNSEFESASIGLSSEDDQVQSQQNFRRKKWDWFLIREFKTSIHKVPKHWFFFVVLSPTIFVMWYFRKAPQRSINSARWESNSIKSKKIYLAKIWTNKDRERTPSGMDWPNDLILILLYDMQDNIIRFLEQHVIAGAFLENPSTSKMHQNNIKHNCVTFRKIINIIWVC